MNDIELALIQYDGNGEMPHVDLVYDALKEKQKREKGCEYCKQTITVVKMDFETDSILGENKWFSSTRRPNYCPMCGRKLGGDT